MSLFHAYVVGGEKVHAQAHVQDLLKEHNIQDVITSEHVTFSVDDARTLKSWQSLTPTQSRAYVCLTEFITLDAQHALLKTLEEPAEDTHIFLCVKNPDVLLETLHSRVQLITPGGEKEETLNAEEFVNLSLSDRLKKVAELLVKEDDEEASALMRQKVLSFLGELEGVLSNNTEKYKEVLKLIYNLKKYVYIPGASMRIILEAVAMNL